MAEEARFARGHWARIRSLVMTVYLMTCERSELLTTSKMVMTRCRMPLMTVNLMTFGRRPHLPRNPRLRHVAYVQVAVEGFVG